jgi:hypothetical protein
MALTARLRSILATDSTMNDAGDGSSVWRACLALGFLARMVREDRHGGTLLVVPDSSRDWMASLEPFAHEFQEPDSSIRDSIRTAQRRTAIDARMLAMLERADVAEDVKDTARAALAQANWHPEAVLRPVARLAAVDGAVVLTTDLCVLGFGAMISTQSVPEVHLVRPEPDEPLRIDIEEAGGARHQSAIRFVGHHRGSAALVISHDGHLSLAYGTPDQAGVLLLRNAEWWI